MMYGDQNISKQTQQLVYALYQIYMITNISQYVLEHLTDQPEDISLFAHPRVPEASLKLKYNGREPGLS